MCVLFLIPSSIHKSFLILTLGYVYCFQRGRRKRQRERETETGTETEIDMRQKHQLVASCVHPDRGSNPATKVGANWELNPQPFGAWDNTPTNWAIWPWPILKSWSMPAKPSILIRAKFSYWYKIYFNYVLKLPKRFLNLLRNYITISCWSLPGLPICVFFSVDCSQLICNCTRSSVNSQQGNVGSWNSGTWATN